jgi:hypothetical protein
MLLSLRNVTYWNCQITINKNIMGNLGYGFCPTHPGELLKEEIESTS